MPVAGNVGQPARALIGRIRLAEARIDDPDALHVDASTVT
jgi:hypothetical protein